MSVRYRCRWCRETLEVETVNGRHKLVKACGCYRSWRKPGQERK